MTYLHLFQQEEYDNRRFLAWVVQNRAWDQRLSFALIAVWLLQMVLHAVPQWAFGALAGLACIAVAAFEADPRKSAKKKLVMTARAKRIYLVALAVLAVIGVAAALVTGPLLLWVIPVQLVPLALVVGNLLLAPVETRTQQRYWNEARDVLRRVDPM